MIIGDCSNKKIKVNSSHKDAFFTFWIYSISFYFFKIGIYENTQGIANKKKAEKIVINKTNKSDTGRINVKKPENLGTS